MRLSGVLSSDSARCEESGCIRRKVCAECRTRDDRFAVFYLALEAARLRIGEEACHGDEIAPARLEARKIKLQLASSKQKTRTRSVRAPVRHVNRPCQSGGRLRHVLYRGPALAPLAACGKSGRERARLAIERNNLVDESHRRAMRYKFVNGPVRRLHSILQRRNCCSVPHEHVQTVSEARKQPPRPLRQPRDNAP